MAFLTTALLMASLQAQPNTCASWVGQRVTPVSFQQAVASLPVIGPRDEFETTAAYNARVEAALGQSAILIVEKEPEDRNERIRYDADNARLGLSEYTFSNRNYDPWRAFYGVEAAEGLNPSTLNNIDLVFAQAEEIGGSYQAQNGFGAQVRVTEITRHLEAAFDRPAGRNEYSLFPEGNADHIAGYLPMSPDQARILRPHLRIAFVIRPANPFVIRSTFDSGGRTTAQNPYDVTVDATILIGDIQCALAMDADGNVLGAYPTH